MKRDGAGGAQREPHLPPGGIRAGCPYEPRGERSGLTSARGRMGMIELSQHVSEVKHELAQRATVWDYCGDVADCVAAALRKRGWSAERIGNGHEAVQVDDIIVDLWDESGGLAITYVPLHHWVAWCES